MTPLRNPLVGRLLAAVLCAAFASVAAQPRGDDTGKPGLDAQRDLEPICSGERRVFELPPFAAFDGNGDGRIGRLEAGTCETLAALFDRLDLDADQMLSPAEYGGFAALRQRRGRAFGD